VPSLLVREYTNTPLDNVVKAVSTVIYISCVVRSLGESMVGNQRELASVSPCVHICLGLFGSVPRGLINTSLYLK
jgi:hypothetical protein